MDETRGVLLSLLLWAPIALAAYLSYGAIRDLFLSPLAHIPGSFWSKVSTIPSWYHAAKGDRHIWIWRQHQIYGEIIRVTPTTVLFKSPTAFRDIYSVKANVTRAKSYELWQRNGDDVNTLNTSDLQIHRSKRRLLNLAFTEKSLRSAEEFVVRHVDRWNELLQGDTRPGEWSKAVNIAEWTDYLSFDIMGDLSFGVEFNTKEPGENQFRKIPTAIHEYMKFTYPLKKSALVDFMMWAKPRGLNAVMKAITPPDVKTYYDFIEKSVRERQKSLAEAKEKGLRTTGSRADLLHYLCEAKHPDHGGAAYGPQELLAEANLLIVAGSDSTSIQLSSFFFYITHNLHCYQKLVSEIRSTFVSAEEVVQGPKLTSCSYLRACLDEAMRLTPPGPSELPRLVRHGGQLVDGTVCPEGTHVGVSMWSSGRHEDLGDPFVYRPERWIPDVKTGVTEDAVRLAKSFSHPFIAGPHNCVGQNLAMLELLITVGRTLWRCDVRIAPGSTLGEGHPSLGWGMRDTKQYMIQDYYISARDGPMLEIRTKKVIE